MKRIRIPLAQLRQSPPRHTELPSGLQAKAKAVWERIKRWDHAKTYERFEANLCCDEHPEREIECCDKIATAHEAYMELFPKANAQRIYEYVTIISTGNYPPGALGHVVKALRNLYGSPDLIVVRASPN